MLGEDNELKLSEEARGACIMKEFKELRLSEVARGAGLSCLACLALLALLALLVLLAFRTGLAGESSRSLEKSEDRFLESSESGLGWIMTGGGEGC